MPDNPEGYAFAMKQKCQTCGRIIGEHTPDERLECARRRDGRCQGQAKFHGVSLSLTADSDADAQRYFAALAAGGQVHMPLAKTFFSSLFGIVVDRFGVNWMVVVRA